ncbi:MAG TPA: FMN-binding protein [Longimicrobiales bacterium]|nr:FMN-binding protein [Longimicrobiales bacterium]
MSGRRLPMAPGDAGEEPRAGGPAPSAGGAPSGGSATGSTGGAPTPGAPVELESSSVRLVGTLAVAGALAGLAIVTVFQWAEPRIEAWRARVLSEAVTEVLAGAERYETVYLDGGVFTASPAADTTGLDRAYVGYDRDGRPVGVALTGAGAGFQDVIRLIFGYDPGSGEVIGMRVLESKETPGLGDKIEKDSSFVAEFGAVEVPLVGLKAGRETGAAAEVTMITGATISSRAIIDIINGRLDQVRDQVDALWSSGGSGARAAVPGPAETGARPGGSIRRADAPAAPQPLRRPGGLP